AKRFGSLLNRTARRSDRCCTGMTLEQQLYQAIASHVPTSSRDTSAVVVTRSGTLGRLTRMTEGPTCQPGLDIEITHLSQHLIGLRSPVSLSAGRPYRLQVGSGAETIFYELRVVTSRRRADGTFDAAAEYASAGATPRVQPAAAYKIAC